MRFFPFFLYTVFFLFSLVGCSSQKIDKVSVTKMENFSDMEEDSITTFSDLKEVEIFINGFNKAKKEPGIVVMSDPEYKVIIGDESYFLWLSEDHGTVMNTKDTHRISTLSKNSARNIYTLLNEKRK